MDNMDLDTSAVTPHPPPDRLLAFGLGKLDVDEGSTIADHISSCDPCRSLVEAVTNDSLAGLFRQANDRWGAGGPKDPKGEENGRAVPLSGYEVLEILGQGGMGVVYKARQIGLGRLVALKQLRPEILAGDDSVARFHQEAEAVARLNHEYIVRIFDKGLLGGLPFYSMEYVEGGTLAARLAAGPLDPTAAARLVETLAQAMHHAHEAKVVHRDLKPSNVLLAPDLEHAKISDFGLAKLDNDANRTRSGVILGTPSYMAPEQAEGDSARVGPSADIYALGAILYETLTGRPPFRAPTALKTLELVRTEEPIPPRQFPGEISRDLETITLKCLEKSPDRRYASARALADDLNRLLEGEPILARPISRPERLAKWAKRRPWQAISAALGIVMSIVVVAGTLVSNARLRTQVLQTDLKAAEARAQQLRAEKQYRSARETLQGMFGLFDDPRYAHRKVPEEIRRELLEATQIFYQKAVSDVAPTEFEGRLDRARAVREAVDYQIKLGKRDQSLPTLRLGLALLDALEAERPDNRDIAYEHVNSLIKMGMIVAKAGRIEEAIVVFRRAISRADRAFQLHPASPELGDALAWSYHSLGIELLEANRARDAVFYLSKSSEIRDRLLRAHPDNTNLKARLAESLSFLGMCYMRIKEHDRADVDFGKADDLLRPLARAHPENLDWALVLCRHYCNWGTNALETERFDRAVERCRGGLEVSESMLRSVPDWTDARKVAMSLNSVLAYALFKTKQYRQAVDCWDRAIALDEGEHRLSFRMYIASCLPYAGNPTRALAEAEALAKEPYPFNGGDIYELAGVASLAAGSFARSGSGDLAEKAADRAMEWLNKARELELFRDPEMLAKLKKKDDDLEYLRDRHDFKLLLLDAAFPADPLCPVR